MRPPSLHSNFFSSLKQVEKRLKLENPSQIPASPSLPPPPPPPTVETNGSPAESLSSPLYLNFDRPNNSSNSNSSSLQDSESPLYLNFDRPNNSSNSNSSSLQDSEPPREFLSNSPDFPPTHEDTFPSKALQDPQATNEVRDNGIDDIGLLIQLLGLSDDEAESEKEERVCLGLKNSGGTCGFECGFYAKIVGVKGPKCEKEVERLNGWIKHFLNGGGEGRRQPLRLTHLLLGKAAFLSDGSDCFGGFQFPSTIQEFLQNDPPQD